MNYCQNCGEAINDNAVMCVKCGCALVQISSGNKIKSKIFFILLTISALLSVICGVVYGYQEVNPKYYGSAIAVMKDYAEAGSISAIAKLNAYNSYMTIHSVIGYIFLFFLIVFITLLTTGILIRTKKKLM